MTSPNDCILILFVASVTVHVRELDKPPTFVSCTFVFRHVYGNCTYKVHSTSICVKQELACMLPLKYIGEYFVKYRKY
jgi:hypothetical protein